MQLRERQKIQALSRALCSPATCLPRRNGRLLQRQQAAEKIRQNQQGFGRPVVSFKAFDHQMVAVGDTFYHLEIERFPLFLADYIRNARPAWAMQNSPNRCWNVIPLFNGITLSPVTSTTIKERGKDKYALNGGRHLLSRNRLQSLSAKT